MSSRLTDKVFCVTGGAAGIGQSTAKTLLARGAFVGICDINAQNLRTAVDSLNETEKSRVFIQPLVSQIANR
jgi:NAD(P)-dependent dehydrogenase (short-subunit alcohol dehydrogenase family)